MGIGRSARTARQYISIARLITTRIQLLLRRSNESDSSNSDHDSAAHSTDHRFGYGAKAPAVTSIARALARNSRYVKDGAVAEARVPWSRSPSGTRGKPAGRMAQVGSPCAVALAPERGGRCDELIGAAFTLPGISRIDPHHGEHTDAEPGTVQAGRL